MKPDDFYERLSKIADYRVPPPVNPGQNNEERTAKRRLAQLKETDDWQDDPDTVALVEQLEDFVKPKKNYTMPIELVKVKIQPRSCEDCGETVTDRRLNIRIVQSPEPHWRRSCTHCRKTWNPETGLYDLSNAVVQAFFVSWLRRRDK